MTRMSSRIDVVEAIAFSECMTGIMATYTLRITNLVEYDFRI